METLLKLKCHIGAVGELLSVDECKYFKFKTTKTAKEDYRWIEWDSDYVDRDIYIIEMKGSEIMLVRNFSRKESRSVVRHYPWNPKRDTYMCMYGK